MTALPTIHLNGTSKQELLDGYANALNGIEIAIATLRAVEFNRRDYYTQLNEAWTAAVSEREDQFIALRKIEQKLAEIITHIQNSVTQ